MPVVMPAAKQAFFNSAGAPLVGGQLRTFAAGTSTPKATYSDAAGTVPNTNPVILDARGEASIYWSGAYKIQLEDSTGAVLWTVDNVIAVDGNVQTPDGRATLPSGTTVDLGLEAVRAIDITGTASIQSFGSTALDGAWRLVRFLGASTLVYNATSMLLPGGANVACAAGDVAIFVTTGSGNWVCWSYFRAAEPAVGATGQVRIGAGAPGATSGLQVSRNVTGGATAQGVSVDGTIQSDVTTKAVGLQSVLGTAIAAFTVANIEHVRAAQAALGAGSAVTSQAGFVADASLVGATNNFGFRGQIPFGTNRWNLYMDGTAYNFMGAALLVGASTPAGSSSNQVPVVAGAFQSIVSSIAAANATNVTLFTLPTPTYSTWIVSVALNDTSPGNYSEVAMICQQNSAADIVTLKAGALVTISLSGLDVQASQSSGGSSTILFTATRVG